MISQQAKVSRAAPRKGAAFRLDPWSRQRTLDRSPWRGALQTRSAAGACAGANHKCRVSLVHARAYFAENEADCGRAALEQRAELKAAEPEDYEEMGAMALYLFAFGSMTAAELVAVLNDEARVSSA